MVKKISPTFFVEEKFFREVMSLVSKIIAQTVREFSQRLLVAYTFVVPSCYTSEKNPAADDGNFFVFG